MLNPSPSHCTPRHLFLGLSALLLGAFTALACGPVVPKARPSPFDRGVDEDGDNVPDSEDACPAELEDGLQPRPNDGCAATDPDRDGILGGQDRCPDAKEDRLFPRPKDGCPIADADHDGVGNTEDRCLDLAEDNQDPDPGDGCPAPDADADGIVDVNDKCPAEAETINGYRDADGCPDTPAAAVAYDPESFEIVIPESKRTTLFADSSTLSPEAQATLVEVAKVMAATPQIERLEIEAHTATRGDAAYNLQLTTRRADAIAHYLIRQGIAPGRLVPIGFGEQCPAVNRGDDVEEPRNRRVAFKAALVSGLWQTVPRGCWHAQTIGIDPTRVKPEITGDPF